MSLKDRFTYNPQTDILGKGGFSTVYKAFDKQQNVYVAIKFFSTDANKKYSIREELKKVTPLEHPNIVRYLDLIQHTVQNIHGDEEQVEVGVLEFVNGGDLKDFLKKNPALPWEALKKVLTDVLAGIAYLHQNKIIHRDLNPKNILVKTDHGWLTAKITDFGISKSIDATQSSSSNLLGTINYMAPEQFEPRVYGVNGKIGTNLDLWSFGAMAYEVITGKPLFGGGGGNTNIQETMKHILMDPLPPEINQLPYPFNLLVQRCLVRNASQRIQSAEEAIALLNNPQLYSVPPAPEVQPVNRYVIPPQSSMPPSTGQETMVIPKTMGNLANPATAVKHDTNQTVEMRKEKGKKKRVAIIASLLALVGIAGAVTLASFWDSDPASKQPEQVQSVSLSVTGDSSFVSDTDSAAETTSNVAVVDSAAIKNAELKSKFNTLVANGKTAFENDELDQAKQYYNAALAIYPGSRTCTEKIEEIDARIAEKQREARFIEYKSDARIAYSNARYEDAKSNYQQALSIYPNDKESSDKIVEINGILKKKNCKKCGGTGTYSVTEKCPDKCSSGTVQKTCPASNCYNGRVNCSSCNGDGDKDCSNCSGGQVSCGSCGGDGRISCPSQYCTTCMTCSGTGRTFNPYLNSYFTCTACYGTGQYCTTCGICSGSGYKSCYSCGGDGEKRCTSCNGSGEKNCSSCSGSGKKDCSRCGGDGKISATCPKCSGGNIVKSYTCSHE